MSMERRVGFTLTEAQIAQACEAFVAARLLPDEEAKATILTNAVNDAPIVYCEIGVSKKRIRKARKNGAQA